MLLKYVFLLGFVSGLSSDVHPTQRFVQMCLAVCLLHRFVSVRQRDLELVEAASFSNAAHTTPCSAHATPCGRRDLLPFHNAVRKLVQVMRQKGKE